jgi:hypothetical protein
MIPTTKAISAALLVAAILAASPAARAQDAAANASAAQALFESAVEEMAAKNYASACPKLEEATRLVPEAIGAKVELAQCYEAWGRTASAWSQWSAVEALAARQNQIERRDLAAARVAELRPKLATLTITVDPTTAALSGVSIKRDGVLVGPAQWSSAIPIDAGDHVLEASAPGHATWTQTVRVEADGSRSDVAVPALEPEPAAGSASPPSSSMGDGAATGNERPWQAPVGVVVMGVGGAALVVGSIFGAMALGANGDSNDGPCSEETNVCDDEGLALRDDALGHATVSTIGFIAGGVLAAGGLVLFLTAPDGASSSEVGVTRVRLGATGALAEGRF